MKKVIVTGSSRGIGRATALGLARAGYDPVLHCVSRLDAAEEAADAVKALGGTGEILRFDVSNREESKAALDAWVDEYVRADVLAREKDGKYILGDWAYKVSYAAEWEKGLLQKRVDRLCSILPIQEAGTIHVDAFHSAVPFPVGCVRPSVHGTAIRANRTSTQSETSSSTLTRRA